MADCLMCARCGAVVPPGSRVCGRCRRPVTTGPHGPPPPIHPLGAAGPPDPTHRPSADVAQQRQVLQTYPVSGHVVVEGQVRGSQVRAEAGANNSSSVIMTFRVARYDEAGDPVALVPVEMRGNSFEGSVSDGDWVSARGRMRRGTLRVKELNNLTTGAVVRVKPVPKVVTVLGCLVVLAILSFIAWIAYTGFTGSSGP